MADDEEVIIQQREVGQPQSNLSPSGETYHTSCWNGYKLYCHKWEPTGPPKAIVFISHGVIEHLGRYEKLAQCLAESGIIVYGHDHVGHGRSEGLPAHVEDFHTYGQDVIQHVEYMKSQHPDLPSFLMGHSMGGLISARVVVERPDIFVGLILSAPPVLYQPPYFGSILKYVVRGLAYVLPRTPVLPWDTSWISSIPEEVREFEEDPLIYHGKARCGWASALVNSTLEIGPRMWEISLPILLIHGVEDRLVPIVASEFAYTNVSSEDKTFERFDGCRHEVLHDRDHQRAKELIRDWVLAHLD